MTIATTRSTWAKFAFHGWAEVDASAAEEDVAGTTIVLGTSTDVRWTAEDMASAARGRRGGREAGQSAREHTVSSRDGSGNHTTQGPRPRKAS
jgi:hypothetical protein